MNAFIDIGSESLNSHNDNCERKKEELKAKKAFFNSINCLKDQIITIVEACENEAQYKEQMGRLTFVQQDLLDKVKNIKYTKNKKELKEKYNEIFQYLA